MRVRHRDYAAIDGGDALVDDAGIGSAVPRTSILESDRNAGPSEEEDWQQALVHEPSSLYTAAEPASSRRKLFSALADRARDCGGSNELTDPRLETVSPRGLLDVSSGPCPDADREAKANAQEAVAGFLTTVYLSHFQAFLAAHGVMEGVEGVDSANVQHADAEKLLETLLMTEVRLKIEGVVKGAKISTDKERKLFALRTGVQMIAANDPAMLHFDAMMSTMYHLDHRAGPEQESMRADSLADDDIATCMEIVRALAGNRHVQTIQTAINNTWWSTDAAVDRMIESLPQTRVVDVDIARYQCSSCNGETSMAGLEGICATDRAVAFGCCEKYTMPAWCHDAESVRASKARLLMEACFQNALERLRSNDPALSKLKYHNKFFEAHHIDRLASAITGNNYVETLVICDAGIHEDEFNPDLRLRATWRHDQATMTALKTAIRQSALTTVELFTRQRREKCRHHDSSSENKYEHCTPVCTELDALCANNRTFNKWIALNRPYQRMLLAAIYTWLDDLPFSADFLELLCGHLRDSVMCPGRVAVGAGAGVGTGTELERFAWHENEGAASVSASSRPAKRARVDTG
jgi:hypothetical protein